MSLSQEFMHELAFRVKKLGSPFIWVVRNRPLAEEKLVEDIIPSGFEERVFDRGFILRGGHLNSRSWLTPPLVVFAHYGWSPIIEALGFWVYL